MNKAKQIQDWAEANYNNSYGAQVLYECFDTNEINETFADLAAAIQYADLITSQYEDVTGEIF